MTISDAASCTNSHITISCFQQNVNCTCDVDGPEENSLSSNFAISSISSLHQQLTQSNI